MTANPRLLTASVVLGLSLASAPRAEAACTPTGFIRDGIDMTAAHINPGILTSPVDATGCHIAVYFDHNKVGIGNVSNLDITGASYFGVLINADGGSVTVNVRNTIIHNIGEVPFNGAQHGIGIYVRAFFAPHTATGEITGNTVYAYQKGGIVVNGAGAKMSRVNNNRVFGQGHVTYIAQNGIQVGYGAMPYPSQVVGNTVVGNSYIGFPGDGSASAGLLVVGGPGYGVCPDGNDCPYTNSVVMAGNILFNNDVGVYSSNAAADFTAPPAPTTVLILGNLAGSDFCYNQSYQAGIAAQGNTDYIFNNYVIQGGGYGPSCGLGIDITGSVNTQHGGNNVTPVTTAVVAAAGASGASVSPARP